MRQSRFTAIIKLIGASAAVLLVVLVGLIVFQLFKIRNLESKSELLDTKIAELNTERENLKDGMKTRSSDTYVEFYARDYLNMLEDGDIIFIIK